MGREQGGHLEGGVGTKKDLGRGWEGITIVIEKKLGQKKTKNEYQRWDITQLKTIKKKQKQKYQSKTKTKQTKKIIKNKTTQQNKKQQIKNK